MPEVKPPDRPAPSRLTTPTAIVVYEEVPYDEPVRTTDEFGVSRETGRRTGTALNVRGDVAHLDGKLAYPLDGGDPLPYGPGKPGHWGRNARNDAALVPQPSPPRPKEGGTHV